jgi:hypothetical protein
MSSLDTSTPLSAIPPHLQVQYRTTPPLLPQSSAYGSYSQANGQDSSHSYTSTPPNNHHEYGQYAGQYQQQQQQQQQSSAYPGYPPTYSGQTASHQAPTSAPSSNLTDALASIPDDQKVRIPLSRPCVVKKKITGRVRLIVTH